ncbi:unnamed protein product, partial [Polarella glacialis]
IEGKVPVTLLELGIATTTATTMFASRLRCAVACTALVVLPRLLLETGMLEILVHSQF